MQQQKIQLIPDEYQEGGLTKKAPMNYESCTNMELLRRRE
jgi:hypothetical protein